MVAASCGDDDADDASTTEAPDTAAPSTEAPTTDAPTTDAPSTEPTGAPTTESPVTEPPATDPPVMKEVRFVTVNPSMTIANVSVALSLGYFEDEGLDFGGLPVTFVSSPDVIQAVLSGDADIGVTGATTVIGAIASERELKSYAMSTVGAPHGLSLNTDVAEALAAEGIRPDSTLEERVQALDGLTLSVSAIGSLLQAEARSLLLTYGLDPDSDVTLTTIGGHPENANAAREGLVDGYFAPLPEFLRGGAEGWGVPWIQLSEMPGLDILPVIDLFADSGYAEENPDVIEAMVRALARVRDDFANDPEMVAQVLKDDWFADMDQKLFDDSFASMSPIFAAPLTPTEESYAIGLELYNQTADSPTELTFEDVYDPGPASKAENG
jgi:NitT/TauT family transport system substrate-binding protein